MKRIGLSVIPLVFLFTWLAGCIGIVPMRRRTVAQQGATGNIDTRFLKPGETRRGEVLDKLRGTDTGFASDRFFVGRWRTSKAGAWIAIGTPAGYGGFAADRLWRNTNLVVRFDNDGAVESYELFPDKMVAEKLLPVAQHQRLSVPEQLETSFTLNGTEIPVSLLLLKESLEFAELARFHHRPQYHYTIPRQALERVTVDRFQDNVAYLNVTFHFTRDVRQFNGPRGKKIGLQMTVPELITVLAYASEPAG
jgi:hypothetical protein